jgi:CheY-like chemotaxis protein
LEDDENDVFFFRRALTACDYGGDLRIAQSTNKARDYLEGRGEYSDRVGDPLPDLIVTDFKVRGPNGIEFLQWVRQQEIYQDIPVVVYSGSALPRDKVAALESGALAFFNKESDFHKMRERVRNILTFLPKREGDGISFTSNLPQN